MKTIKRMNQTNINCKRVLVALLIGLTLIVLQRSSKSLMEFTINTSTDVTRSINRKDVQMSLNKETTDKSLNLESRETPSTSGHPSCHLDQIVVKPESISLKVPPEIEKVVPLWANTTADKCIGNIKTKPRIEFSSDKNHSFYRCVEKNKKMRAMRDNSFRTLDRSITHSYFKELKKKQGVSIIEIGGYLGVLMPKLLETTGAKKFVALEPVPHFFEQLSQKIGSLSLQSRVTAYNFGLAKTKKELQISLRKDATSLLKNDIKEGVKTETIKIFYVIDFFVQIGLGCNSLNLLTINCEGCEFDLIEMLTSTSLIDNIDYVQFQPHVSVFDDQQKYICMYCRLKELLSRTHTVAYEYPHVWETWKRKGLP